MTNSYLRMAPEKRRILSLAFLGTMLLICFWSVATLIEIASAQQTRLSGLWDDLSLLLGRIPGSDAARLADDLSTKDLFAANYNAAVEHIRGSLRTLSADGAQVQLSTVRVMAKSQDNGIIAARISAELSVVPSRLFDIVNTLEAADPPITIDSIKVASRAALSVRQAGTPLVGERVGVNLQLSAYALLVSSSDTRPARNSRFQAGP